MKKLHTFAEFLNENLNEATTLASMFAELGTWITFTDKEKEEAKKSRVTDRTNPSFEKLVKDWSNGMYDEDPELVAQQLRQYLDKKNL